MCFVALDAQATLIEAFKMVFSSFVIKTGRIELDQSHGALLSPFSHPTAETIKPHRQQFPSI
jgi:hypothetical protein